MKRAAGPLALIFAIVLALAACGGDSGDDDAGLSSDGGDDKTADVPDDVVVMDENPAKVTALDNTFRAENIQVKPGTEVVWTNGGRNEHNVLPAEGDQWGVEVDDFMPGSTYSMTFEDPGVYRYYCSLHATKTTGMIGAVVVAD